MMIQTSVLIESILVGHPNSLKNLKPWVKGQSGFTGRTHLRADLQLTRTVNAKELAKIISKYARMTLTENQEVVKEAKLSILDLSIASIFLNAVQNGDFARLNFLLDRCIGKVKDIPDDDETDDAMRELQKLSMRELFKIVKDNLPEGVDSEVVA